MPTLSPQQEKKLRKLAKIIDDGNIAVAEYIMELEEKIEEMTASFTEKVDSLKRDFEPNLKDVLDQVKGKDGYNPVKGKDYFTESEIESIKSEVTPVKGVDYVDGEDYIITEKDKMEIAQSVSRGIKIPIVEKVIERTEIIKEQPVIKNFTLENPVSGQEIVDKINALEIEPELQIEASHIKGLEKELKEIRAIRSTPIAGGVIGRDIIKDIDISTYLDGSTKTFSIPAVYNVITVNLSSFPYGSLRKGVDFTYTPTTITFTDTIDASTQLSEGQSCVLTVVSG